MKRLTNKKEADSQRREYENRLKNGYPRNIPEERFLKLAAYEDTMSLERAQELAQAEKDGRLVVLPCKKIRYTPSKRIILIAVSAETGTAHII